MSQTCNKCVKTSNNNHYPQKYTHEGPNNVSARFVALALALLMIKLHTPLNPSFNVCRSLFAALRAYADELVLSLRMKGTFCLQEQTFLMLHIDQKLLMQQI